MLSAVHVSKTYRSKKGGPVSALKDVSLSFGNKGMVFVLGRSGSGKSTLLNILGGIDMPDEGEIVVNGRSSKDFAEGDYDAYRNRCVGFVFQEYDLIENYTVGQNVALALEMQGRKAKRETVDSFLRQVDLTDETGKTLYDRRADELSGGQKQRVAIARALIKEPDVVFADEPTGALDEDTEAQIYKILKKISETRLVIVVTHDRDQAKEYGDRIIELKEGQIKSDSGDGTDEPHPASSEDVKSFAKCRFPLKRKIGIGIAALSVRKLRLVFAILLAVISFTVFGGSCVMLLIDEEGTLLNELYSSGQELMIIDSDNQKENAAGALQSAPLQEEQLEAITEFNGGEDLVILDRFNDSLPNFSYYHGAIESGLSAGEWNYITVAEKKNRLAELDPDTGEEDANLTPDPRFLDPSLCRLPQTFDEIAITDFKADLFLRYGFVEGGSDVGYDVPEKDDDYPVDFSDEYDDEDYDNENVMEIATPDDLIGKEVDGFTIVGVYSTEVDKEKTEERLLNSSNTREWFTGLNNSIAGYCFVKTGYLEKQCEDDGSEFEIDTVMVKSSGSKSEDKALLRELRAEKYGYYIIDVTLYTPASGLAKQVEDIQGTVLIVGSLGAVLFGVVSVLFTLFYLNVNFDSRRREIGILRAMGAKKGDITAICLSEIMTMTVAEFLISLLVIAIVAAVANAVYEIAIFTVSWGVLVLFSAFCIGTTLLASIVPIRRITDKSPVEILK